MKTYLAFDIGGTKLKYALINDQGQLLKKYSEDTQTQSKKLFLNRFNEIIAQFESQISGIGISVPGKVDPNSQKISFGGSLPFLDGISFSESLNTKTPVFVENDAKAATLAELWRGALKDINNGVMLVLGTAVGSGIVIDHQLIYGSHQQAGEVSFLSYGKFDMNNLTGGICSAVGLIQDIAKYYHLADINDGQSVFALIKANKAYATKRFQEFCKNIALLIHNMQTVIDVERFVIGGGISRQTIVTAGIKNAFDNLRSSNNFVDQSLTRPQIVSSELFNEANLYGAISRFELNARQTSTLRKTEGMY